MTLGGPCRRPGRWLVPLDTIIDTTILLYYYIRTTFANSIFGDGLGLDFNKKQIPI